MKTSAELEQQAALQVVSLMAAAARTAPKTRGIDNIRVIGIEDADTKAKLVSKMKELAKSEDRAWFEWDASCVEKSSAVLLIGVAANPAELNCGYCAVETMTPEPRPKDFCCLGCFWRPKLSPKNLLKKGSLKKGSSLPAVLTVLVVEILTMAGLTAAVTSAMALPVLVRRSMESLDILGPWAWASARSTS